MRILFISRAYPPIVGGIENQNYELSRWLPKHAEVRTIANRHGKRFLPFFLPYATIKALFLMPHYDALLLGDGVLGIVGWIVKSCFPKKTVVSIIHGLDLTFKNALYQRFWVHGFIPALDGLIAVGNETIRVGKKLGISESKFTFIPNGVDTEKHFRPHDRNELEDILGLSLIDKHVLITSGRLAKRKGVAWFIRNVMPLLPENVLYIVAGDGSDRENIEHARSETGLIDRVRILGYVTDSVRDTLLNTCDLFVQPNIRVEGDMEGFGISVIEAASCGLPVVAADLEGLKDAIKNGENGYLATPEDSVSYITIIQNLLTNQSNLNAFGQRCRRFVIDHYSWEHISALYAKTLEKIAQVGHNKKEIS